MYVRIAIAMSVRHGLETELGSVVYLFSYQSV